MAQDEPDRLGIGEAADGREPPPPTPVEERDLGFGSVVAQESRQRLLNPDGSFNVRRAGLSFWSSLSLYQTLIHLSWPRFILLGAALYVVANTLFGAAFAALGPYALVQEGHPAGGHFLAGFFCSVQTFGTIGYGHISPEGAAANLLVTLESVTSLISVALATGLVFARFSRPTARIVFSRNALIAPYQGITALEFRVANARSSQIIELEAKLTASLWETVDGVRVRRFHVLRLERNRVVFFPLSWTVVHPIDENSPLYGMTEQELLAAEAEFLVLLTGIDETFAQAVHARSSYRADEVVWQARFASVFRRAEEGEELTVDLRRLHDYERAAQGDAGD